MKRFTNRTIAVFLAVITTLLLSAVVAFAADTGTIASDMVYVGIDSVTDGTVVMQKGLNGSMYWFLPSSADFSALTFSFDEQKYASVEFSANGKTISVSSGVAFDFTPLCSAENEHPVRITAASAAGVQTVDVKIMRSSQIRSLYLVSSDPENYGRKYVEKSKNNTNASGNYFLVDANGHVDFQGALSQIKARGNSSFNFAKKPYQIKLDKKAELVNGAGKSKKWVLLANVPDPALIRNAITYAAAEELGLAYTSKYELIDLYYDGEYRGNYMLCEKVEVGDNRVEIDNTDDLIEDLNKKTDAYINPVTNTVSVKTGMKTDINASGSYRYVEGLIEPEFPENALHHAYLLEFEFATRYHDELTGFITDRDQRIVTKNPEYLTKEQGAFIASFWQEFEDAVYSPDGFNKSTGKYYYEYCDLESLAKCYLLSEISKNQDYYGSSTFFYLAADSDMFYCGPLWDYDLAYGIGYNQDRNGAFKDAEYFFVSENPFCKALLGIQSFRDELKKLSAADGEMTAAVNNLTKDGGTIDSLTALIYDSQRMEYKLWDISNKAYSSIVMPANTTFDSAVKDLKSFVKTRYAWLSGEIAKWNGSSYTLQTKPVQNSNPPSEQSPGFFQMILNFFRSILDFFRNLFK